VIQKKTKCTAEFCRGGFRDPIDRFYGMRCGVCKGDGYTYIEVDLLVALKAARLVSPLVDSWDDFK
jgi:hypothetical protein